MPEPDDLPSSSEDDLRQRVARELRRARRHLLACVSGVSEELLERPARRGGGCMKWHLGHAAFLERQHLARLTGPLADDWHPGVLAFGPQSMDEREGSLPLAKELFQWLAASRKLTEALAQSLALEPRVLDVFRDLVDADHAQARFLRARRAEAGLAPVAEPRSRLLRMDTECDVPPRFHLAGWTPDEPRRTASGGPVVVSIEDRRHQLSSAVLERGHACVRAGDLREALRCFEEAERWQASADAVTFQAWMHSLLGDIDTAEKLCLRAISLDPDFGNPYNDIGTICLQRRDVPSAIEWFQRAKKAPRYEPRHFPFLNLGRVYLALGKRREALAELEGALALAPGSDDIRLLIERVRDELRQGSV